MTLMLIFGLFVVIPGTWYGYIDTDIDVDIGVDIDILVLILIYFLV